MAALGFFDLHCHPGLKTFFTDKEETKRDTCWTYYNIKGFLGLVDRLCLGNMFDSGSSLTQLIRGNVSIAVVGLYAFERAMIEGEMFRVCKKSYNILTLSGKLKRNKRISYELMEQISRKDTSYFEMFEQVQTHLLRSQSIYPKFKLVNEFGDIDENMLNIVLSIEGGHNLFDRIPHNSNDDDKVLKNLNKLKTGNYRYFFFAPAHAESNPICTHAYAMKLLKDDRFLPDNMISGISDLGKEIIKTSLEQPNRILIDIKHMSLVSRLQYYELLKTPEYSNTPIIMSHGGVTGVSWKSMPIVSTEPTGFWEKVKYYKPAGLMRTSFNPWSINLYDEEIKIIIKSKGLIGLNLDERILGTKHSSNQLSEYFSKKDFEDISNRAQVNDGSSDRNRQNYHKGRRRLFQYRRDVKHLCNNILHIIKIAGPEAWAHVCIGSDFDGMVNAIDPYNNAEKLEKLKRHMIKWLPKVALSDRKHFYFINNAEDRVNDIMFRNAFRFLEANFKPKISPHPLHFS